MYRFLLISLFCSLCALPLAAQEDDHYRVDWHITLLAGEDLARVALVIADGRPVRRLSFRYDPERFSDFEATGELEIEARRVTWTPPRENARLDYRVKITRERSNRNQDISYDALMTDDWALFRGDRLIPGMAVTSRRNAVADTLLHFDLPDGWGATTGWPPDEDEESRYTYRVDDPDRRFDRPTGWMLAGRLGSRRDHMGNTVFSVAAPVNSGVDRMGWLTLVRLVYPEIEQAFGTMPPVILMVSAGDPLWRGGLSGPNSFYFHSSRRAISENGTSPLLHELVHVITRIRGADNDDWITEGLAEYYSVELLYRAGGYSAERKQTILETLADWGRDVHDLRRAQSTGPVTARAAVLFHELDTEIAALTDGEANLDAVTRRLMEMREISLEDLQAAFESVTGAPSAVLKAVDTAQ